MNIDVFKESIRTSLTKNYLCFEGRATRQEFWYFVAFCAAVSIPLVFLGYATGFVLFFVAQRLFSLFVTLPYTGVAIRRLHDIGKSGWWLLAILIPFIGLFILIYLLARPSMKGSNQYNIQR
ncbi:MAG: DUF805 domain-containing protein [Pseudomonadota bacterium]